ncbi:FKBP-type peptidyl-prolyl cis-trans isomerase [Thalassotalea ponticola]|uniref:FKBP-type peptidyl-prolyl cis-trans isomerase n=1 Tax=Thalassotalea ponticola TaxID=1523392 RepID=UPI0025B2FAB4|nr:FKBP-type peptidyl-prolyl cis-trans isomerase [Thalassotalea ponticola]MDN3652820.1 FKBP-type peptidyl-prolyl cis-trans isomerase [Thalassotalea ponticola]
MKFITKPTMVAVAVLALIGCNQQQAEKQAVTLDTEDQKQAYALGASLGNYMTNNLAENDKLEINLDKELILAGFEETMNGKGQFDEQQMQDMLMALDQRVRGKREALAASEREKALTEGKAFLANNAEQDGVVVTESGLQYQVLTEGEGDKPAATDTVKVHYKGTLIDGTEFDSSYKRNQPIEFPLNRVIKGWTEGVQLMSPGSHYKFVIPADLAYGEQGTGPIPGNATLIFEVELLEVIKPAEQSDS